MGIAIRLADNALFMSVHTPDFEGGKFLVAAKQDPNVAVILDLIERGITTRHWAVSATSLREMTQSEKDAQDAADLPGVKEQRKATFPALTEAFIATLYSPDVQSQLAALFSQAVNDRLTNRAAYINQFFAWRQAIYDYQADREAHIDALHTIEDVLAMPFEPERFAVADPRVTVSGALAIRD